MKYLVCALVCICTLAVAGPVGRYLGIELGRVQAGLHVERESIHMTLPSVWDTVMEQTIYDTSTVVRETTYAMRPAWLTERKGEFPFRFFGTSLLAGRWNQSPPRDTPVVMVDTSVENTDTTLLWKLTYSGMNFNIDAYHIPFRVGNWWRMGIAGRYYYDVTGDSIPDTIDIWGDTTRIIGRENVVVPYRMVLNTYKLSHVARQSMRGSYQGIPVRESAYIRGWHWYKDSLGSVKDSNQITGVFYMRMIVWLKAGNFYAQGTGVLLDYYVGQSECPPARNLAPRLTASPNPFRTHTAVSLPADADRSEPIQVRDASGRLVRSLSPPRSPVAAPCPLTWDGLDDKGRRVPPGVYLARTRTGSCLLAKLE